MLYPVELWDQTDSRSSQGTKRCAAFSFTQCQSMKKGRGSSSPLFLGPLATAGNHRLLSAVLIFSSLSLLFFLPFLDFLPASAEAPLEQHPAEADLLQDAPLVSVDAEAPLEQQPADLDLSHDAFPSVEAEAPLAQHPADLDLSQLGLLAILGAGLLCFGFLVGLDLCGLCGHGQCEEGECAEEEELFHCVVEFLRL